MPGEQIIEIISTSQNSTSSSSFMSYAKRVAKGTIVFGVGLLAYVGLRRIFTRDNVSDNNKENQKNNGNLLSSEDNALIIANTHENDQ